MLNPRSAPMAKPLLYAATMTVLVASAAWLGSHYSTEPSDAPLVPSDGDEVLEQLRDKKQQPRADELESLRARVSQEPRNLPIALELAQLYIEESRATNDPRYKGYAAAVIEPWLDQEKPPPEALVLRATLRQSDHDFDGAIADLKRALTAAPRDPQAWVTLALILQVQGELESAKRACVPLFELSSELAAVTCHSGVEALGSEAQAARDRLRQTLASTPDAPVGERLWALTLLGEIHARLAADDDAEQAFKAALELAPRDAYLLGAYADLLLKQKRWGHVLTLLEEAADTDGLLLRLALAEQALGAPTFEEHRARLAASFEKSRARGDLMHSREEARYALAIEHDPSRALDLAVESFKTQREPPDVRLLLEAALATGRRDAASPALAFLDETGLRDTGLRDLAKRVRALPGEQQ